MNAPMTPIQSGNIGAALFDSGKINAEQLDSILQYQKEHQVRFGEAAVALRFVSEGDIAQVLAKQFDYPYLSQGESRLSTELVAAYQPFSNTVENLRALRNQLMLRWLDRQEGTNTLAIVSAGRGEGRSWLAANLAIVFSQLGEHTLLVDADLRNPRQHRLFGLDNRDGLSQLLAERATSSSLSQVANFRDLTVLTAGPTPPNPQELICCSTFISLVNEWQQQYDVVLIDTPAMSQSVDAQSIAGRARGALLVARKDTTPLASLALVQEMLTTADASIVGAVVNEF
ncbi:chain length determinant protein tyrosine kinase EpsG [Parasulfuritortus cantonensis]|uniref:Chain length determinant protein tyrosine kinase EpsG n=1 Tax=Parasulfuritortus cantonensis TaxID=2528202 RepID=A0A4R1BKK9_9PROT|nr:chain length determinant protein tyrosine kinase EpsG [Parasulfuritortus cantonensis]TCJ17931.1 chain length determinant protein tyrosine kinase EpsG [Parasulfuritortus cantonensis]